MKRAEAMVTYRREELQGQVYDYREIIVRESEVKEERFIGK